MTEDPWPFDWSPTGGDPLRAREVSAVLAYRKSGDRAQLEVLRQDGLRELAHALTMEGALPEDKRARYTAEVDKWLRAGPVDDNPENQTSDPRAGQDARHDSNPGAHAAGRAGPVPPPTRPRPGR